MARDLEITGSQRLYSDTTPISTPYPFTVAVWVYPELVVNSDVLFTLGDASGNYVSLEMRTSGGVLRCKRYNGGGSNADISTSMTANNWYHACAVIDAADSAAVFLDGGGKGTSGTSRPMTTLDRICFGARYTSGFSQDSDARFAEAGFWNTALSDAEVAILAAGYAPPLVRPGNLVAYWRLLRDEDQDIVGGYDLSVSGSPTVTEHPPGIIYRMPAWVVVPPAAGAGGQTISPSGIASLEAFGSATLTTGAVTIDPSGIASLEAFGSATLTIGAITLSPSAIASLEAFGSATLATGAVSITPTGIASLESFGSAVIALSGSIIPSGIASLEAFGSATLATGAVSITPSGIASLEAFGSATVALPTITLSPSAIASLEAFGSATLTTGVVSITPSGIASAESFGTSTVQMMLLIISATGIASAESFGSSSVSTGLVAIYNFALQVGDVEELALRADNLESYTLRVDDIEDFIFRVGGQD